MRVRVVAAFIVVVAAFFAGGWLLRRGMTNVARPETTVRTTEEGTKLFNSVVETVRNYAVDSLDDSRIYRLATSGVLGELTDPYAALIPAADTLRARTVLGPDAVQGMYLDWADGLVTVVAVVPGSPAARAGARSGDAILRIGNTTLGHQTPEEAARLLAGPDGSTVRVRVGREAGTPALWLSLVRGPAVTPPAPSVEALDGDLALVRAFTVDSQAAVSLRTALDGLGQRGGRGLVLDLRGAVGGTLDGVVAMADALLGRDQSVVVAVGRGEGIRPSSRPGASHRSPTSRWWCSSTRAPLAPPRRSPARSRIMTAPW
ncbi:MAG: PDZ domain-containing protein [Gemmatimonadales bacterium]